MVLRVSRNFWTWGSSALPGGKRPVHSHSSCQPRSSLYLVVVVAGTGGDSIRMSPWRSRARSPTQAWYPRERETEAQQGLEGGSGAGLLLHHGQQRAGVKPKIPWPRVCVVGEVLVQRGADLLELWVSCFRI